MNTLFIGGTIFIALIPLFKGLKDNKVDSHGRTFWEQGKNIEQRIQESKDKALGVYPWINC